MQRLSYLRQRRGISQSALARLSGVPRGSIAVYEAYPDRHAPGMATVMKLADALNVSVYELIDTRTGAAMR